ncbi:hypothetical protein WA026_023546 [Henosepilachna vigintioctopunctata]|uniref:SCP domain-containing protein n=1 Tax=Henosepilachna vigintioctopunctata TaxID=420089 RepID=A0AAW1UPW6_9CUCU
MIIFFSLWLIIVQITSIQLPSMKYKSLLTKNYSKRWLHNIVQRQSATNPYCNLCCLNITQDVILKDCKFHTMCIYKINETGQHCRGLMPVQFTEAEKYTLLDAHNTLRNTVASGNESRGSQGAQPPAANMRKLEWDDELAVIAETWTRQCQETSDRCRDVERFPVGQNVGSDYASKSSHLGFIHMWYESVVNFSSEDVAHYTKQASTEKYTQIVWAETYRVGCARAVFQKVNNYDVIYQEILVCNYGPAGNIPGQQVYMKGTPCSACYEGSRCESDYPSLCARIGKVPVVNILNNNTNFGSGAIKVVHTEVNYNGKLSNFNLHIQPLLLNFILSLSFV